MLSESDFPRLADALNAEITTFREYRRHQDIVTTLETERDTAKARWLQAKAELNTLLDELGLLLRSGMIESPLPEAPAGETITETPDPPAELPLAPAKRK